MPKGEDQNEFRFEDIVEHPEQSGDEGKEVLTGDSPVDDEVEEEDK
jgi:hypothetical protein